jgi:hypothetical protein
MKISIKAKSKKTILNKVIMKLKISVNDVKRILKKSRRQSLRMILCRRKALSS